MDFGISHGGKFDVTYHVKSKHHQDMMKACSSKPLMFFIKLVFPIALFMLRHCAWASFVVEHNLAFNLVIMPLNYSQRCFLTQKSLNLLLVVASKLLVS